MSDASANRPLVLHVLPVLHPSGAERIAAELARRLPQRGFETRVLCLEDERAAIGAELRAAGIPVHGLRLSRRRTVACAGGIARHLIELGNRRATTDGGTGSDAASLAGARCLILHAHLFHANIAARLAVARLPRPRRAGVCVINTVQVVERRFRPWHFWLDRWTARWCHAEVCVSEDVRRFQQARTGLPADFFRVIENAVDVSRFAPAGSATGGLSASASLIPNVERGADENAEHGQGRQTRVPGRDDHIHRREKAMESSLHILAVGRLDPQKDYPTLLRAWQLVNAQRPNAQLTIAGKGPERARLESLARSLGLVNVEFAGFVSDVPSLLGSADLFVQASLWEGLPLSVIEAMAAGLPIVATDAEGTRNVIAHERTGLLVPRSDPRALAQAILRLINDPATAANLASAAQQEAAARFSVDAMVAKYAALYREVLARRSD